jgi:L-lactate permease
MWEILEVSTAGLGDAEQPANQVLDIIIAWVGWFIIILIFTRRDIPWFSARRTCGNCGKKLSFWGAEENPEVDRYDDYNATQIELGDA